MEKRSLSVTIITVTIVVSLLLLTIAGSLAIGNSVVQKNPGLLTGFAVFGQENLDELQTLEQNTQETEAKKEITNLHWKKMPITYRIKNKEVCGSYESHMIKWAFKEIEEATNSAVRFQEVSESADIEIQCELIEDCYESKIDIQENLVLRTEKICGYTKGKARITDFQNLEINKAEITLYGLAGFSETTGKGMSGFFVGRCGYPETEIHEILHTLGYGHKNDENSIMRHKSQSVGYKISDKDSCQNSIKSIDSDIVADLVETYSSIKN